MENDSLLRNPYDGCEGRCFDGGGADTVYLVMRYESLTLTLLYYSAQTAREGRRKGTTMNCAKVSKSFPLSWARASHPGH